MLPSVMLLALMKRVNAFLESEEAGTADPVQQILHWTRPRCKIYDQYEHTTLDASTSPNVLPDDRIHDVYVHADSRECYITYRYVTYRVSPALPTAVGINSIWQLTSDRGTLSKTLRIDSQAFQMDRFDGVLPWLESARTQKIRPEFAVDEIPCTYTLYTFSSR